MKYKYTLFVRKSLRQKNVVIFNNIFTPINLNHDHNTRAVINHLLDIPPEANSTSFICSAYCISLSIAIAIYIYMYMYACIHICVHVCVCVLCVLCLFFPFLSQHLFPILFIHIFIIYLSFFFIFCFIPIFYCLFDNS